MGATITPEQVLLLKALVEAKAKSTKWVLENEPKLKKPLTDTAKADLVAKLGQYNALLPLLGGTALN